MDPTIKVALIVAIPATITGLGSFVLSFLNRKALENIHVAINSRLSELLVARGQVEHAAGRREGLEAGQESKGENDVK